jgi:hypothetical protein
MGLFKRRLPNSTTSAEVVGLSELAASRGWQRVDGAPFESGLAEQIWHVTWSLYGRRERSSSGTAADPAPSRPNFHDAYRGEVDGRRIVVVNHSTNLAQVRLWDTQAVSVCAVELGTMFPVMLVKPRDLPFHGVVKMVPTGIPEFDDRFSVAMATVVDPQTVFDEGVRQRIMAHDDWAFLGSDTWLVCVGKEPFSSAADVTRRLDEVFDLVRALPASIVPAQIDRSVDDLAVRIEKIASVEDALTFLEQLTPEDRQRLAASNTPLAPFADVTTPDEAMARLQSLDMPQRMQLLGMFQRLDDQ